MHGLAKRQALSFVNFVPAVVAYCVCQALPAEFTQPGAQRLAVPYSPTDHAHIAALCLYPIACHCQYGCAAACVCLLKARPPKGGHDEITRGEGGGGTVFVRRASVVSLELE